MIWDGKVNAQVQIHEDYWDLTENIGNTYGNREFTDGIIYGREFENDFEMATDFDFLFYYVDRDCLPGLIFIFNEEEVFAVRMDKSTLIT